MSEAAENARIEALEAENAHLLDELQMAYEQMERILVTTDSETRATYEALRQRNVELEQRLAQLEKAHGDLQKTQHMLLRAERMSAMGQMAAAIVHELNNPLTVMASHLQMLLLKETDEDSTTKESLQTTLEYVWNMHALTQNILGFARKRQGAVVEIDLNELVSKVMDFFQPLLKRVEVHTDLTDELPPLVAEPTQLEQILTNFIVNAIDALESIPQRRLYVSTGTGTAADLAAQLEADGWHTLIPDGEAEGLAAPCLYVQVRDNGSGIDPKAMSQIFDAFFTTKDENKGTGLGLATSRSIAAEHGGHILVGSRLGEGASFALLLPRLG